MVLSIKTKLHNILININYRSERQSHIYYWQYFEHMLKQAHDENNNIICLGDMNKNFLGNLPHNVNDILVINGLVNIINKQRFCDNINENRDDLKTVNSKMYWKTIHMLLKNDRSTNELPPLHDPFNNFNLAYDATQKSNVLNTYFCSITMLNDDDAVLPDFHDRCENILSQVIVTEQEVIDMLCTLNANKAVGPDIISNRMLVSVKEEISKPLCSLFNKSLREKVFPSDWKIAHVIPLFKNGDKSLPSNYRPISLLSCVSKVLEKIILITYLKKFYYTSSSRDLFQVTLQVIN